MRVIITLACTECKRKNYTSTKNKRTTPDKLEFKITFTNPLESIPHLLDNQAYKNGFLTGKPAKDVSVQDIIAKINKLGLIHSYSSHEPGLEDIFLTLTGENNA